MYKPSNVTQILRTVTNDNHCIQAPGLRHAHAECEYMKHARGVVQQYNPKTNCIKQ